MKNKTVRKITLSIVSLFALTFLMVSCSKKNDSSTQPKPASTSHQVVFKATVSAGSNITDAVYGYDSNLTSATGLSGTTWTSPTITVPAGTTSVICNISGFGVNASSTIEAQIYVDGKLVKTATGSGTALIAEPQYSF